MDHWSGTYNMASGSVWRRTHRLTPVPKGAPFPSIPLAHVAAKLTIRVDGLPADPVNQIGWPDAVNTYRLDFRVPKGTHSGMAEIEVTADGITGRPVTLPIR